VVSTVVELAPVLAELGVAKFNLRFKLSCCVHYHKWMRDERGVKRRLRSFTTGTIFVGDVEDG
jgi:hypothetical protein